MNICFVFQVGGNIFPTEFIITNLNSSNIHDDGKVCQMVTFADGMGLVGSD